MPRYDLVMITTVEADSFEDACEWLGDWANGVADSEQMFITSEYPGMASLLPGGQRIYALLPVREGENATGLEGADDIVIAGPIRDAA